MQPGGEPCCSLPTLIPARACTFIIGAGSVIIIVVRRWPRSVSDGEAYRGTKKREREVERGARATTRSGIRDILGQGVGNHYWTGERRYFFHAARSGVVLSISRRKTTDRSFLHIYIYIFCSFLFLEVLYEARAPGGWERA